MFVTRSSDMNIEPDINIHLMSIEQLYPRETSQITVSPGRVPPQLSGRASAAMSQNNTVKIQIVGQFSTGHQHSSEVYRSF